MKMDPLRTAIFLLIYLEKILLAICTKHSTELNYPRPNSAHCPTILVDFQVDDLEMDSEMKVLYE